MSYILYIFRAPTKVVAFYNAQSPSDRKYITHSGIHLVEKVIPWRLQEKVRSTKKATGFKAEQHLEDAIDSISITLINE